MNKVWLIIKREYLTKVKKKSFIIMTFLGPLLFGGLIVGAVLIASTDTKVHDVLIVDEAGWVIDAEVVTPAERHQPRANFRDDENMHFYFQTMPVNEKDELNSGKYTIVVKLDSASYFEGRGFMAFKSAPSLQVQRRIQSSIENSIEKWAVERENFNYETYKRIRKPMTLNLINVDDSKGDEKLFIRAGLGFGLAIMIYLFIFLYGVQVMRGVMEEKTNRIVEVIISSVKPFQLMMGKVIGIGLVGVTQFVMWMVLTAIVGGIGLSVLADDMEGSKALLQQTPAGGMSTAIPDEASLSSLPQNEIADFIYTTPWLDIALSFLFFFIGGYLLYGSLFAAVGAAVDQESDTQQFMLPVTLPLIFGYFISFMMIQNPEGSLGTIFSIVPLTSPIVMMVKTAIGVNIWLRLASMVTLVIAFIFFIWLAGRIYRVGILMYGKKPTYRELWKWIRYNG